MDEERWGFMKKAMFLFTVANLIICVAYIAISIVLINSNECPTSLQSTIYSGGSQIFLENQKIFYDLSTKEFSISGINNIKETILSGLLGNSLDLDDYNNISLNKSSENDFQIDYKAKSRAASIKLRVNSNKNGLNNNINCKSFTWTVNNNANERFAGQEFEDCFRLGNYSWFGGAESFAQQFWPINEQDYFIHLPYVNRWFRNSIDNLFV